MRYCAVSLTAAEPMRSCMDVSSPRARLAKNLAGTYDCRMDDAAVMAARKALADEIASLMGRRRVNQTQLAKAVGVGQSYLSRRLAYLHPFTWDELIKIAHFFDLAPTDLLASAAPDTVNGDTGR